jgi:hypothetical protein
VAGRDEPPLLAAGTFEKLTEQKTEDFVCAVVVVIYRMYKFVRLI